jgi:hypothetical protein
LSFLHYTYFVVRFFLCSSEVSVPLAEDQIFNEDFFFFFEFMVINVAVVHVVLLPVQI